VDYLQTAYSKENQFNVKNSPKTLHAIQAAILLLRNRGGKIILFNASSSWIKSKKEFECDDLNNSNGKTIDKLNKQELTYSAKDPNGYMSNLGKTMSQSLISLDLFLASQGNIPSVLIFINLL
jgi:hypothetical protein